MSLNREIIIYPADAVYEGDKVINFIKTSEDVAKEFGFLKIVIDMDDDPTTVIIDLKNTPVNHKELEKSIRFMEQFLNDIEENKKKITAIPDQKPLMTTDISTVIPEWLFEFLECSRCKEKEYQKDMFSLIIAANFLDNKLFVELLAATVTSWAKLKTAEELMEFFHEKVTMEDIERVRKEKAEHDARMKEAEENLKAEIEASVTSTASANVVEELDETA